MFGEWSGYLLTHIYVSLLDCLFPKILPISEREFKWHNQAPPTISHQSRCSCEWKLFIGGSLEMLLLVFFREIKSSEILQGTSTILPFCYSWSKYLCLWVTYCKTHSAEQKLFHRCFNIYISFPVRLYRMNTREPACLSHKQNEVPINISTNICMGQSP